MFYNLLKKKYESFETLLCLIAVTLASLVTWQVYLLEKVRLLVDQNSHLNLSRQMVDSLTPGISQIGFWPPLLHIIMAPVTLIDPIYRNGLAGFFSLLPFLLMAAIFLYKICQRLIKNNFFSFWCALLFIFNPYVLYYTATPMMEIMYMANLFAVTYFMIKWIQKGKLQDLLWSGMFITLTSLSRFEGLILIPLAAIIILVKLLKQRKTYYEIESLSLLFSLLSVAGLVFIFAYGFIFGNNPMSFMNSQWSAYNQQRDYFLPTEHNLFYSFLYLVHAAYHLHTMPIVLASLLSLPLLLILRPRLEIIAATLLLASPFLFDYSALFRGNAIIYVPELPPFGSFFNERYGLYWLGFILVVPTLFFNTILEEAKKRKAYYFLGLTFVSLCVGFLSLVSFNHFYRTVFADDFAIVKKSAQDYPTKDQVELAKKLRENYDFGKILMTRALHDFIAVDAKIPLHDYILEANYKFYDQALDEPWLFARWVVMYNPDPTRTDKWATTNEAVSKKWGNSEEFHQYYDLVLENDRERLYKIKEDAVIVYATRSNYNLKEVPSLNSNITYWNPDNVYEKMRSKKDNSANAKSLPTKTLVSSQMVEFYSSQFKPLYAKGYYVDPKSQGTGNSETQSYALMQAYLTGDQETFKTVWNWTKNNLQRKNDHLFSWKYKIDPMSGQVKILDKNPATDADTDIAYALLLAGEKWSNDTYKKEAQKIMNGIWEQETTELKGKRIVIAGTWANTENKLIVNPSYIAPPAYKLFARYDKTHDWTLLINDSYELLSRVSGKEFRKDQDIFLPPNWVTIDKKTGKLETYKDIANASDYTYDAFRTFWRVSLDQQLFPNNKAQTYLSQAKAFETSIDKKGDICTYFTFKTTTTQCELNKTTLAGPLSVFVHTNPKNAEDLVKKYYLTNNKLTVDESASYYEKSWYWLSLGLYSGYIKDITVLKK